MNPLTVFPRHPSAPDTYYINGAWAPACITAVEKRFTDAELAAEVWRQEAQVTSVEAMGGTPIRNIAALKTLERFATLPHHDDGPA